MDSSERYSDPQEAIRASWEGFRAALYTALPGIIQSFNAQKMTAVVKPAIQGVVYQFDPVTNTVTPKFIGLPLLLDVPVVFPRGGACTLTFPVANGDECLVVFSARSIDNWWQSGGVQPPLEPRMHDLSDGFALVGPFSQATAIQSVSANTVQLRSNDGSTYVELNPSGQIVNVVAPGGMNITAPTVAIQGALTVTQTVAAQQNISSSTDVLASSISLKTHKHSGVQSGGALTGLPQ